MTTPPSITSDELDARLARVETILDEHAQALTAAAAGGDGEPEAEATEPVFASVQDWVSGFFIAVFTRAIGGEHRWCSRWWAHDEAHIRLEALWRAWEHLRLDPQTGMAVWLRDHLDHQLPRLTAPTGPFARCTPDRHEAYRPLPTIPPPPGWPNI